MKQKNHQNTDDLGVRKLYELGILLVICETLESSLQVETSVSFFHQLKVEYNGNENPFENSAKITMLVK